jgi:hypothetical protein
MMMTMMMVNEFLLVQTFVVSMGFDYVWEIGMMNDDDHVDSMVDLF